MPVPSVPPSKHRRITKLNKVELVYYTQHPNENFTEIQTILELPNKGLLPPENTSYLPSTDLKISKFLPNFLKTEGITSRGDLNLWCKKNGAKPWGDEYRKTPLYNLLRQKCSKDSYRSTKTFEASIRANYEKLLSGYETSKK